MNSCLNIIFEISNHSKKGINFYSKFGHYITNLQGNINDFITAREFEKQSWVENIE